MDNPRREGERKKRLCSPPTSGAESAFRRSLPSGEFSAVHFTIRKARQRITSLWRPSYRVEPTIRGRGLAFVTSFEASAISGLHKRVGRLFMRSNETEAGLTEQTIAGVGLSVASMQAVARRQLVGSVVVAMLIAAAAGLTAIRPGGSHDTSRSAHDFADIQQPTFVTAPGAQMAAMKHDFETP